jgi:MFS family permease
VADTPRLSRDFWWYFAAQSISALGSSFAQSALPLVIFQLTGSATSLGAGMAVRFLPYLLFGLLIGAITDRVDRKQMLIHTDLGRATDRAAADDTILTSGSPAIGSIRFRYDPSGCACCLLSSVRPLR